MKEPRNEKHIRSINFSRDVLDYLSGLSDTFECSRSYLINAIVREHAHGGAAARSKKGAEKRKYRVMPERLK